MPKVPELTNKERVYNLVVELEDLQSRKKTSAKTFGEEIKRVKAEIADYVDKEENGEEAQVAPEE